MGENMDKNQVIYKMEQSQINKLALIKQLQSEYNETEKFLVKLKSESLTEFIPPTLQQVQNYIKQMHFEVDAEKFVTFYQSKGWKKGTSPMTDWKATVKQWHNDHIKRNIVNKKKTGASNFTERTYTKQQLQSAIRNFDDIKEEDL